MFILTIAGNERDGAYSVQDETGEQILYLFEEEDDATRFALMLEDNKDYPEMNVMEVEDEIMIKTCEVHGYNYAVITPEDIVIPPETSHDII
jgi:hypothetical protein|tara:strand:- start:957 stop:1232 length:276 start_codon:yes stop_codon:yes gene_type:complete